MHFCGWLARYLQDTVELPLNIFNNFKTKASPGVKQEKGLCHSRFRVKILING